MEVSAVPIGEVSRIWMTPERRDRVTIYQFRNICKKRKASWAACRYYDLANVVNRAFQEWHSV